MYSFSLAACLLLAQFPSQWLQYSANCKFVTKETRSRLVQRCRIILLAKQCCLSSVLLVETLLSCINQYCWVLILNCFIVNNKSGSRKSKWYSVTVGLLNQFLFISDNWRFEKKKQNHFSSISSSGILPFFYVSPQKQAHLPCILEKTRVSCYIPVEEKKYQVARLA